MLTANAERFHHGSLSPARSRVTARRDMNLQAGFSDRMELSFLNEAGAVVRIHILLSGSLVDDDGVDLAVEQGLDGSGAAVVSDDGVLTVAALIGGGGGVLIAGGNGEGG